MATRIEAQKRRTSIAMVMPAVLLIILVSIIPFINALRMSVESYNLMRPHLRAFVGIENFVEILMHDTEFRSVVMYSLLYTTAVVVVSYLVGFMFALLLNRPIRFISVYRALVLLAWIIPSAVAAANWRWILNDHFGFINVFLVNMGFLDESVLFLAHGRIAQITVVFTSAWKSFPFMAVVLLAGLQSIPSEMYEVAEMDGAGGVRSFFNITLPMVKPVTTVAIVLMFVWTFNNFENVYLLTRGGPAQSTFTLPILGYFTAFFRFNLGYAAAISVVMLVVLVVAMMAYLRLAGGGKSIYES